MDLTILTSLRSSVLLRNSIPKSCSNPKSWRSIALTQVQETHFLQLRTICLYDHFAIALIYKNKSNSVIMPRKVLILVYFIIPLESTGGCRQPKKTKESSMRLYLGLFGKFWSTPLNDTMSSKQSLHYFRPVFLDFELHSKCIFDQ